MTPAELEASINELCDQRTHLDVVILARQRMHWLKLAADPAAGTNGLKTRRQCLGLVRRLERLIVFRAQIVEAHSRLRAARCSEVAA